VLNGKNFFSGNHLAKVKIEVEIEVIDKKNPKSKS
jgi:hypothetical protein